MGTSSMALNHAITQSRNHLTCSIFVHLDRRLCVCIVCIFKETLAAPGTKLPVMKVLTVVTMQAVRAHTPPTVDTCILTILVAQGEFLSRGKLREYVVLVTAPITFVAIIGQMEQIAKVAALGIGFVI